MCRSIFFFFNDTATTEIYTLSLHDALPICSGRGRTLDSFLGGGFTISHACPLRRCGAGTGVARAFAGHRAGGSAGARGSSKYVLGSRRKRGHGRSPPGRSGERRGGEKGRSRG